MHEGSKVKKEKWTVQTRPSSHDWSQPAMPPLKLSDEELTAVMQAAQPIAVDRRDAFLRQVAAALQSCGEVGPGIVHRVLVETQRVFFDPPDFARSGGPSKHSRYG
jgi:hypothetical protein